jgi:hypothetical protein
MPTTAAWLLLALFGQPTVEFIYPSGGSPGSSVRVGLVGSGLDGEIEWFSPDLGTARVASVRDKHPSPLRFSLSFDLSIDRRCAPGVYLVWLRGPRGLSRPIPFFVDVLKEYHEPVERGPIPPAIPIPAVVNGLVHGPNVDSYRFRGQAGEQVGIDVWAHRLASMLDPRVVLRGPNGRVVAESDDVPGLGADCRLVASLPVAGDYTLEIHDSTFQGERPAPYRIRIGGAYADEVFPLGGVIGAMSKVTVRGGTLLRPVEAAVGVRESALGRQWITIGGHPAAEILAARNAAIAANDAWKAQNSRLVPPILIDGRLDAPGAQDRFRVSTKPGRKLRLSLDAERIGSKLDAVLSVSTAKGKSLLVLDDAFRQTGTDREKKPTGYRERDPRGIVTVPSDADELVVSVSDRIGLGGIGFTYRLEIVPAEHDFVLTTPQSGYVVPSPGVAVVQIDTERTDYSGPIRLAIDGLPAGLSASEGLIPAGSKTGYFSIVAAPEARPAFSLVGIVGRPDPDLGTPCVRTAYTELLFSSNLSREYVPRSMRLERILLCPGPPAPFQIRVAADSPIRLRRGATQLLPIEISGASKSKVDAKGFSALGLPPGIKASFRSKAPAGQAMVVELSAEKRAAVGPFSLIVQAKTPGLFASTTSAPAVRVTVVEP